MTDRVQLRRLILQVERAVLAQASLRTLLTAADAVVAAHRLELRTVKARITRAAAKPARALARART